MTDSEVPEAREVVRLAFEHAAADNPNTMKYLKRLADGMQRSFERATCGEVIDVHLAGCVDSTALGICLYLTTRSRREGIDTAAFVAKGEDAIYLDRVPTKRQFPQIFDHEVLHVVLNRLGEFEASKALDGFDGGTWMGKPNPWGSWTI